MQMSNADQTMQERTESNAYSVLKGLEHTWKVKAKLTADLGPLDETIRVHHQLSRGSEMQIVERETRPWSTTLKQSK
jgi:hypothetical protein